MDFFWVLVIMVVEAVLILGFVGHRINSARIPEATFVTTEDGHVYEIINLGRRVRVRLVSADPKAERLGKVYWGDSVEFIRGTNVSFLHLSLKGDTVLWSNKISLHVA